MTACPTDGAAAGATDQTDSDTAPASQTTDSPFSPDELTAIDAAVEAVALSLDRPATTAKIAEALAPVLASQLDCDAGDITAGIVTEAIERLNGHYATTRRAFRIEPVAGGVRLMTLPEHASAVAAFHRLRGATKLSRPALETLAIIAYRQPITRARLEAIRGVACGEVLRALVDRRFIRVVGRAEELGRPMLYGTTPRFLDHFGLASLAALPKIDAPADPDPMAKGPAEKSSKKDAEPASEVEAIETLPEEVDSETEIETETKDSSDA